MKKSIIFLLSIFFTFSIYAKDVQELVVTTIPPMSCQNCENKIKKNLRWEKGVKKIETNIPEQKVTIEYDAEKTNPQQIEEAFHKIGYNVEVINPETPSETGTCSPGSSCANKTIGTESQSAACCN